MSDEFTEKEWEEAMARFLKDGGEIQKIERGVSGREEGVPQSAWGRPKKKPDVPKEQELLMSIEDSKRKDLSYMSIYEKSNSDLIKC